MRPLLGGPVGVSPLVLTTRLGHRPRSEAECGPRPWPSALRLSEGESACLGGRSEAQRGLS